MLAAAAAFVVAGPHGVRVLTTPTPAPVTVTLPPPDRNAEFLADLDRAGIKHHTSPGDLSVATAYAVCANFEAGVSYDDNIEIKKPGATRHPVGVGAPPNVFVDIARDHYCPQGHA